MNITKKSELTLNQALSLVNKEIKRVILFDDGYRMDFE